MSLRSEKLLQEFLDEIHDAFEYWAEVKIEEIKKPNPRKELTKAENKALQKLIVVMGMVMGTVVMVMGTGTI